MRSIDIARLKDIQRNLLAMAQGNFDLRISRSKEDDVIESIVVLLNMMAEEMRETLRLYSELHTREEVEEKHLIFVLDLKLQVQFVSKDVLDVLGYGSKELLKKSFSLLLAQGQLAIWRKIGTQIVAGKQYRQQHRFILKDRKGQERYCDGIINPIFAYGEEVPYIILSITETAVKSKMVESLKDPSSVVEAQKKEPPNVLLRPKDRKILRAIHDYIVHHVERPLPSLVEMAHQYGINEFKLKYGFKQLYGTTVFRFQKAERLRKGRMLLENTSLPIKSIMGMCGYVNSSHFAKDFRGAYGISPREVRGEM